MTDKIKIPTYDSAKHGSLDRTYGYNDFMLYKACRGKGENKSCRVKSRDGVKGLMEWRPSFKNADPSKADVQEYIARGFNGGSQLFQYSYVALKGPYQGQTRTGYILRRSILHNHCQGNTYGFLYPLGLTRREVDAIAYVSRTAYNSKWCAAPMEGGRYGKGEPRPYKTPWNLQDPNVGLPAMKSALSRLQVLKRMNTTQRRKELATSGLDADQSEALVQVIDRISSKRINELHTHVQSEITRIRKAMKKPFQQSHKEKVNDAKTFGKWFAIYGVVIGAIATIAGLILKKAWSYYKKKKGGGDDNDQQGPKGPGGPGMGPEMLAAILIKVAEAAAQTGADVAWDKGFQAGQKAGQAGELNARSTSADRPNGDVIDLNPDGTYKPMVATAIDSGEEYAFGGLPVTGLRRTGAVQRVTSAKSLAQRMMSYQQKYPAAQMSYDTGSSQTPADTLMGGGKTVWDPNGYSTSYSPLGSPSVVVAPPIVLAPPAFVPAPAPATVPVAP